MVRLRPVEIASGNAEQTERAGAALAGRLGPGDVVLVRGELGSGKTTFVRGACRALGVEAPVTSPTFMIGQLYAGPVEVAHLDMYRLDSLAGEDPALLDDYVTAERIAFVEWPEAAEPALEHISARVTIEHRGGDAREITIECLCPEGGARPGCLCPEGGARPGCLCPEGGARPGCLCPEGGARPGCLCPEGGARPGCLCPEGGARPGCLCPEGGARPG